MNTAKSFYAALGVACAGAGVWSSMVSLDSIKSGFAALETNPAMLALGDERATMLMALDLLAWFLVSLLKGKGELKVHRAMIALFATAVLVLEISTIAGVTLASARQAQSAQQQIETEEKELVNRIEKIEKQADEASKTASVGVDKATNAYEVHLASKSSDKAEKIKEQAEPLRKELKALRATKKTTFTSALGETFTTIYSIFNSVITVFGGTLFIGKAGALLRLCQGQDTTEQPKKPAGTRPVQPRSILQRIFSTLGSVRRSLPPLRRSGSKKGV
jgi:hypothetical protein